MRRSAVLVVVSLLLAAGCGSSSKDSDASASAASATTSKTAESATTLDVVVESTTTAPKSTDTSGPTGKVLMLKLFVGTDLAAAEKFYGTVFGAKRAMAMGDSVHIVTLPEGGPGLVLIKAGTKDKDKYGAFIMQVPDLAETKALALANGATAQGTFAGKPGGSAAKSVDLLDPWGNQIEILELG